MGRPRKDRNMMEVSQAVDAVKNGMSLRRAAETYNIAKSVLHRYVKYGVPNFTRKKSKKNKKRN